MSSDEWACRKVLTLCASFGLSVACHPHVEVRAPASSAPAAERLEAYDQLKPLSYHQTHTTMLKNGVPVGSSVSTDYLQLASGKRVYHAEDLRPVIADPSPASFAVDEHEEAKSTANTLSGIGYAGVVVGTIIAFVPLLTTDASQGEELNLTPIYLGTGLMLASLIPILVANGYRAQANDAKSTAFETYDSSLRKRLNLCANGEYVVPCGGDASDKPMQVTRINLPPQWSVGYAPDSSLAQGL